MKRCVKYDRNIDICRMRKEGATLKEIAAEYEISVIRVRQILERWQEDGK